MIVLVFSVAVAFLVTLSITPYFKIFFSRIGVIATDRHEKGFPIVPLGGGIPVFFGFAIGMLSLVGLSTFINRTGFMELEAENVNLTLVLAALLSSSLITLAGFFDDLNVRSRRVKISSDATDYKIGLRQWEKPFLTLIAAIPLMAIAAGATTMTLPLVGRVHFGIIYPLILIPLAVVCVSNASNMLAGVPGLETGGMAIISLFLGAQLLYTGKLEGAALALVSSSSLLAFLKFNWHPAKMFPGDSLTYFSGATFVCAVILGNSERFAILLFLPWIIEALLKLRGRFAVRSFGDLQKDGTVKAPYDKIYSLTHVAMKLPEWLKLKKKFTAEQVTAVLLFLIVLNSSVWTLHYVFFGRVN